MNGLVFGDGGEGKEGCFIDDAPNVEDSRSDKVEL
jgi:hypothetical protein